MKKKLMTLILAAGLITTCAFEAKAIDFKASGEWFFGFGVSDSSLIKDSSGSDRFKAEQRLRLQIEAIASESLSGTVQFEMGETVWGQSAEGGALGTDGKIVTVRQAYIDWFVPNTELQFRMGLQALALPNVAGGAAVLDDQVAAIVANYTFNENMSVTAAWLRPYNDNYGNDGNGDSTNYLDNMDMFLLSLPVAYDNFTINPWIAYGVIGRNAVHSGPNGDQDFEFGADVMPVGFGGGASNEHAYATLWYAGLPMTYAMDNWNFELDLNYGSAHGFNDYTTSTGVKADAYRQGFVIKALAEYAMDWGTPGVFAWYGSGDDGNAKDGSERMPSIAASSNFTSFIQDGPNGYSLSDGSGLMLSYGGTWGLGVQVRDMSFVEDLSHTLRITYWGGTNSTDMIKHIGNPKGWREEGGMYLTHNDSLVEINFDSTYQIYENLQAVVELGYIFNGIDTDEWNNNTAGATIDGQNGWKAALLMMYSF